MTLSLACRTRPQRAYRQITRRSMRAITMIELLLALAVVAIFAGGVITLYGKGMGSAKETQAVQQIAQVVKSVRQLYAMDGTYGSSGGTSLNASLVSTKSLPDGMINISASTIRHAFGDLITVTGYNDRFTIQLASVPQDGCAKTLTSVLSAGDVVSMQIGSGGTLSPPFTSTQVITDCSAAAASSVAITYR